MYLALCVYTGEVAKLGKPHPTYWNHLIFECSDFDDFSSSATPMFTSNSCYAFWYIIEKHRYQRPMVVEDRGHPRTNGFKTISYYLYYEVLPGPRKTLKWDKNYNLLAWQQLEGCNAVCVNLTTHGVQVFQCCLLWICCRKILMHNARTGHLASCKKKKNLKKVYEKQELTLD